MIPSPVWITAVYSCNLLTGLLVFGCSLQQPSAYTVTKVICLKAHLYPFRALLPTVDSGTSSIFSRKSEVPRAEPRWSALLTLPQFIEKRTFNG